MWLCTEEALRDTAGSKTTTITFGASILVGETDNIHTKKQHNFRLQSVPEREYAGGCDRVRLGAGVVLQAGRTFLSGWQLS